MPLHRHPPSPAGLFGSAFLIGLVVSASGCPDEPRRIGESCVASDQCESGFCYGECLEPNLDLDGDGLSNALEAALKTNPRALDTDGDGLDDGLEVGSDPSNPLDTDGDSTASRPLHDALEPLNRDSDGDCLADQLDADPLSNATSEQVVRGACKTAGVCGDGIASISTVCSYDPNAPDVLLEVACVYHQVPGFSTVEPCDGLDNDCDGIVDNAPADAIPCDDGNRCTDDACTGGACVTTANTGPCEDGNPCTLDDACSVGTCVAGALNPCDDANPCTDDSCDAATGACVHLPNTEPCEDGSLCTVGDECADGVCVPGAEWFCLDSNECTQEACNPVTGSCDSTPIDVCGNGLCDCGETSSTCIDDCQPGSLDPSFSGDGIYTVDFGGGSDDEAFALAPVGTQGLLLCGRTGSADYYQPFVHRVLPNGFGDPSFGTGGLALLDANSAECRTLSVSPAAITIGGVAGLQNASTVALVARLTSGGDLETSFAGDGILTIAAGTYSQARILDGSLVVAADDAVIAFGATGNPLNGDSTLTMFGVNADGTAPQQAPFTDQYFHHPDFETTIRGPRLAQRPDGSFWVVGTLERGDDDDVIVTNATADGVVGTEFPGGFALYDWDPSTPPAPEALTAEGVHEVVVDDQQRLLAVATRTRTDTAGLAFVDIAVYRWLPDGLPDPSFGTEGRVLLDYQGGEDQGRAIALDLQGGILIGGSVQVGADHALAVVRLTANGALDTSFGVAGWFTAQPTSSSMIHGLAVENSGRILGVGWVTGDTSGRDAVVVRLLGP